MVTPPTKDGSVNSHLLAAARKVGVDAVYKVGSAWAIAALAYGTEAIPKVDVIVGPGNIYVTLAKKIVAGTVGIDMIAGPSEILVIADSTANPAFIAADLLSQAEHGTGSEKALLVTPSMQLAQDVRQELLKQTEELSRKDMIRNVLRKGTLLVVVDFLYHRHVYHSWERIPAFHALWGFVGLAFLIQASKGLRRLVMRPEDYYDGPEAHGGLSEADDGGGHAE